MNELISKLKHLGKHISEAKNDQDIDSLNELLDIIDSSILKNEAFAKTASFQNTELVNSFRFNTMDVLDTDEAFRYLNLVAKVCTVYLRKDSSVYDYYVLQEIFHTLKFMSEGLFSDPVYDNIDKDYSIDQREYHYQVSLYKYEFALLEKIRSLLINMFYKKDSEERMTYQEQDIALDKALKRIAKDKVSYINLNGLFSTTIRKGNTYNYLRILRNRLVHGYLNPEKKKNFNLDIYLLFILVFYVFSTLVINLKTDDELVDVFEDVNK